MNKGRAALIGFLAVMIPVTIGLAMQAGGGRPKQEPSAAKVTQEVARQLVPSFAAGGTDSYWEMEIARAQWIAGEEVGAYLAGLEAERLAPEEAEREAAARRYTPSARGGGGGGGGSCHLDGWPVSDETLWRESKCDEGAYNATGCEGWGCVGPAQLHLGHFAERSPWGGVGTCSGLDAGSIADQKECAGRLGPDAWR